MGEFLGLSQGARETLQFFVDNMTIIDFTIIGIGSFLVAYQLYLFFVPGKMSLKKFYFSQDMLDRKYQRKRLELELRIISALIEILPILGIMGTVWGIMNALSYIRTVEAPTINIIAQRLAPALSTTFLGLLFAAVNLIFFNFITPYFEEVFNTPEPVSQEGEGTEVVVEEGDGPEMMEP